MADTATSAGAPVRTERALPFVACARRPAGARRRRGAALPRRRRVAAGRLPRRRRLLRAQRLPDHVAAAGRARGDRAASTSGRFWMRRARRLLPAPRPRARGRASLVAAISLPERARAAARRRARLARLRHQLALIFAEQSYFDAFGRPSLLRTCGRWRSRSSSTCCGRSSSASASRASAGGAGARRVVGGARRLGAR